MKKIKFICLNCDWELTGYVDPDDWEKKYKELKDLMSEHLNESSGHICKRIQ